MGDRSRQHAVLYILAAGLLATTQDAIMKSMSGSYPFYESMVVRGLVAMPILAIWLAASGHLKAMITPLWPRLLIRSAIIVSAYFAFVFSIASIPLATAVAIYFAMPFFVAALSGYLLKEHVPFYRWIAIVIGFAGVMVMVRPGVDSFEPASLLALYSALGYALGQMMGRQLSKSLDPLVIVNWQNFTLIGMTVIFALFAQFWDVGAQDNKTIAFMTRHFVWPTLTDFMLMVSLGIFAAFATVCFSRAYSLAAANFVAPFEYTGMVWAVLFGVILFGDFPDLWSWIGTGIVITAGLFMIWMDRIAHTGYPAQPLTVRNASED